MYALFEICNRRAVSFFYDVPRYNRRCAVFITVMMINNVSWRITLQNDVQPNPIAFVITNIMRSLPEKRVLCLIPFVGVVIWKQYPVLHEDKTISKTISI